MEIYQEKSILIKKIEKEKNQLKREIIYEQIIKLSKNMEHAIIVLEVELGKLRQENLINLNMLGTFSKENVKPSKRLIENIDKTKEKFKSVEQALKILKQNI